MIPLLEDSNWAHSALSSFYQDWMTNWNVGVVTPTTVREKEWQECSGNFQIHLYLMIRIHLELNEARPFYNPIRQRRLQVVVFLKLKSQLSIEYFSLALSLVKKSERKWRIEENGNGESNPKTAGSHEIFENNSPQSQYSLSRLSPPQCLTKKKEISHKLSPLPPFLVRNGTWHEILECFISEFPAEPSLPKCSKFMQKMASCVTLNKRFFKVYQRVLFLKGFNHIWSMIFVSIELLVMNLKV